MAQKIFNASWMGQWRASTNTYYGAGSPVRVGGNEDFESFLGIPSAVRDALKESTTTPKLYVKMYIYDSAPEWSIGGHKLTSNPATGGEPWYANLKTVHNSGTGWQTFDLTAFFQAPYLAGTYQGLVFHSGQGTSWAGAGHNTTSYPVEFVVEGTWNTPPPVPVITYPKGGEIVDGSINFQWGKVTDPNGDVVTYQLAFNTGSGWRYYTTTSNTYVFNTAGEPETSNAQLAVRSFDGQEYSVYRYSEKFSIQHNTAPTAPTQLSPANGVLKNRQEGVRFSWKHNDDGAQAGFQLSWRVKGGSWNYIPSSTTFSNTTNQYYDMPANVLPFGDIEWDVKTKDQQNLESPWSVRILFTASNPSNAPVILKPSNMGTVNTSQVIIEWSSLNQLEYEVILYNNVGAQLWRVLGAGSTKRVIPTVALLNNTVHEVYVRVKDSTTNLWSGWAIISFQTTFSPPAKPSILSFEEAGEGVVNLFYSADNITAGFPVTQEIEMYRREYTSTNTAPWVKIGDNLSVEGSFLDYTIASGQNYEYKVRALNNTNSTSIDSDSFIVMIEFPTSFIQEASNLSNIIVLNIVNSRDEEFDVENELVRFAGRKDPVREFGEHEETKVTVEWDVDTFAEVRHFKALMRKRDVLLFRDGNGRRMWVTTGALSVSDKEVLGFTLSAELTETSYKEDLNNEIEEWF